LHIFLLNSHTIVKPRFISGVKIKKIRASTNTWIKTPARGQDPVFIISGEDHHHYTMCFLSIPCDNNSLIQVSCNVMKLLVRVVYPF